MSVTYHRALTAQEVQLTMKEIGLSLTPEDVKAMMRQAGVGPEGKIFYKGEFAYFLIVVLIC